MTTWAFLCTRGLEIYGIYPFLPSWLLSFLIEMWTCMVFPNMLWYVGGFFFPFLGLPHFFLITKCEGHLLSHRNSLWVALTCCLTISESGNCHQGKVLTQEYQVLRNEECICLCLSSSDDLISLRNVRASSVSALTLKSAPCPVILLEGHGLSKQSQMDKTCRW